MMKLQELRKEKGLYQKEIAKQLHRTVGCISNWELGISEPNIEDLIELSNYFNCSIDYLVGREAEDGTIYIMGNKLTESENKLIDKIRQLEPTTKEIAYRYIDFLYEEQKTKELKK